MTPTLQSPRTQTFGLGGLAVQLTGVDAAQLERVYTLLSHLFALASAAGQSGAQGDDVQGNGVQLDLSTSPLPAVTGSTVYRARALVVTRLVSGFDLRCGRSRLRVTPGGAKAHCFLEQDFFAFSPFEQREFFLLGLLMLLRPFGRFGLHACGLERGGAGLLVVGASGSGKTTTSLNLIRQGWRYLSDDAVLLQCGPAGAVQTLAFRRGFSCTPATLARFPELTGDPEWGGEFGDPSGKRVVHPKATFGGSFVSDCTPSLIVFPTVTGADETTLRPLGATHSLVRLCQQSAGIMTDTAVSQQQLGLLQALSVQAQSFELHLGRDALSDPNRVNALLNAPLESAALKEAQACAS